MKRLGLDRRGVLVTTPKGNELITSNAEVWVSQGIATAAFAPLNRIVIDGQAVRGTPCGLRLATDTMPCYTRASKAADPPRTLLTTWFARPIDRSDNPYIDQTYRYGSTMGGNFQQHQGV